MSLTKTTVIDQITITESGFITYREATRIMEDGKELSKQYKNAIGDKERLEEANRKYLEQMSENALKITDEINNKKMSKHSKKTREELEKIALEELNVFYKELNMEELY